MRILIYTGKGGVGKTTIAAATAAALSLRGKRTLLVSTDPAHSIADSLAMQSRNDIAAAAPEAPAAVISPAASFGSICPVPDFPLLFILELDPRTESRRVFGEFSDYLRQIISEKARGGIAAEEALCFPGLEELCALTRILELQESGAYDCIVVDCAPTGETLALLSYPERLSVLADRILPLVRSVNRGFGDLISRKTSVPKPRDAVFTEFERLTHRMNSLRELLQDRSVTSVRLVSTPERIVLEETRRSFTWLQLYDFNVDAVYLNRIWPKEALQGCFEEQGKLQDAGIRLFEQSFPQQQKYFFPLQKTEVVGPDSLKCCAELLYASSDPASIFCSEKAFSIHDEDSFRILSVRLPYTDERELSAEKKDCDLILRLRNETRILRLPDNLIRRKISHWHYESGIMEIYFDFD